jgi:3-hydroxyisobutyrate dehydrogenase-like beta-hydroxyacid dehydrogenase
MAAHLLDAGHPLVVHDLARASAEPLLARGAAWAGSAGEVARRAKTVITIVPSSREVEAVVGAMLPHLGPGQLLIEMTSADPSSTRRLAKDVEARGARMIDAPVSGGVGGAEKATLAIMVGGEAADFERARPLLGAMGKNIFHVGGIGTGHAMKIVNNVLSATCTTATAEAIVVALRAGIDPARAVEIISASSGRSDATLRKFPEFVLPGNFRSGFAMALMDKDLRGFAKLAAEVGFEPSVTGAAIRWFRQAMESGLAGGDHMEVVKLIGYPEGKRS